MEYAHKFEHTQFKKKKKRQNLERKDEKNGMIEGTIGRQVITFSLELTSSDHFPISLSALGRHLFAQIH